ncbi:hypothetical protein SSS_09816 [Sarcoptes scabiei]|uniref:Uncharacterized protein n=1 Tax=Sarcoptes scabiei TaxID=52283 RepID=A0A834RBX9_SARSC|nr:hypothetical protein SSS_09816 [Sarcoptes scabiei]
MNLNHYRIAGLFLGGHQSLMKWLNLWLLIIGFKANTSTIDAHSLPISIQPEYLWIGSNEHSNPILKANMSDNDTVTADPIRFVVSSLIDDRDKLEQKQREITANIIKSLLEEIDEQWARSDKLSSCENFKQSILNLLSNYAEYHRDDGSNLKDIPIDETIPQNEEVYITEIKPSKIEHFDIDENPINRIATITTRSPSLDFSESHDPSSSIRRALKSNALINQKTKIGRNRIDLKPSAKHLRSQSYHRSSTDLDRSHFAHTRFSRLNPSFYRASEIMPGFWHEKPVKPSVKLI